MDKAERIYMEILKGRENTDAAFIANVILTCCSEPERKLKGLLDLLESGADVRSAPGDMFGVLINGVYRTMVKFSEV